MAPLHVFVGSQKYIFKKNGYGETVREAETSTKKKEELVSTTCFLVAHFLWDLLEWLHCSCLYHHHLIFFLYNSLFFPRVCCVSPIFFLLFPSKTRGKKEKFKCHSIRLLESPEEAWEQNSRKGFSSFCSACQHVSICRWNHSIQKSRSLFLLFFISFFLMESRYLCPIYNNWIVFRWVCWAIKIRSIYIRPVSYSIDIAYTHFIF